MILSVSRRTDIPSYYSDWFFNRIKEGYLYTRNPLSQHQVSKINISPDVVDCIVFWSKNPIPMMNRLDELKDYMYYFQFSITGCGRDIEQNVPDKKTIILPAFRELSKKIGSKRVIWRFDPIVFTDKYEEEYYLETFREYAEYLNGYTEKCVISFVDFYAKIKKNMEEIHSYEPNVERLNSFAKKIADIAHENGMVVATCAEKIDLDFCGITHNACIDKDHIEQLIGYRLKGAKDTGQRPECGCMASIEVGSYNTCLNGCKYCYANFNPNIVLEKHSLYDPSSPILCDSIDPIKDRITERAVSSMKKEPINNPTQMTLWDVFGIKNEEDT
ncbi:MAG: DUF1848 domain-containing protein [Lachnospiraceae bacterium]|nr:DUF1848 domain-containing protein [Lachnospiraceae bacterium]